MEMKRVYAINGSPRRNRNTATLLDKALEGACAALAPGGVTAERIDLYDLRFTGCRSCFACKLKDGPSYGRCAIRDDLQPVLDRLREADAVIFGSPVYYRTITGQLHAFYERLLYPYMTYKTGYPTLVTNRLRTACIYTMNVGPEEMQADGYRRNMETFEFFLEKYFSKPRLLFSFNTLQFSDYSRYVCETFDEREKRAYREAHFPTDCRRAYDLGFGLFRASGDSPVEP